VEGHTARVRSVAVGADGQLGLSGGLDRTVRFWKLPAVPLPAAPTQPVRVVGHTQPVTCMTFSFDGQRLATGSGDRSARLWDLATGKEIRRVNEHPGTVRALALSTDGQRLATTTEHKVRAWEFETGRVLTAFDVGRGTVECLCLHPGGVSLVLGSTEGAAYGRTFDLMPQTVRMNTDGAAVSSIAFSPDGQAILLGQGNGWL